MQGEEQREEQRKRCIQNIRKTEGQNNVEKEKGKNGDRMSDKAECTAELVPRCRAGAKKLTY